MRSRFPGLFGAAVMLAACSRTSTDAARTTPEIGALPENVAARSPANAASGAAHDSVPVLVELFSSEGCSSCPAGERALGDLLDNPPSGTRVIALEEHVDYWDYLGHVDRFASPAFTARQRVYATALHNGQLYTPQAVIDGQSETVGSRSDALASAIQDAAKRPHIGIALAVEGRDAAHPGHLRISVSPAPAPAADAALANGDAKLFFADAERRPTTKVEQGENAGSTLRHTWVAHKIVPIGDLRAAAAIDSPDLTPGPNREIIVFAARVSDGAILGSDAIAVD